MKRHVLILIIILIIAIGLRLPNTPRAMANDEFGMFEAPINLVEKGTLDYISIEWRGEQRSETVTDEPRYVYTHPPGEPLILAIFYYLPFAKETNFRLSMVIFGVVTVYLVFLLGKHMYNNRIGLIAALLAAVSVHGIFHYSFRITKDAMVGTLALLAFLLYFMYMKKQKSRALLNVGDTSTKQDKNLLIIISVIAAVSILIRTSIILWVILFVFYELIQKRWKSALTIFLVPVIAYGTWAVLDYWITGWVWLKQSLMTEMVHVNVFSKAAVTTLGVQTSHIINQLTPAIVAILIILFVIAIKELILLLITVGKMNKVFDYKLEKLSFLTHKMLGGKKKKIMTFLVSIKNFLLRKEIILLTWIAIMYLAPIIAEGGGHHNEKYFFIAAPFVFILAARFFSLFKIRKTLVIISAAVYFLILFYGNITNYLFHNYVLFHNNHISILLWSIPFILAIIFIWRRSRTTIASILLGLYIAFCLFAIMFPATNFTIANSKAVEVAPKEGKLIVTGSEFIIQGIIMYDYQDGSLDNTYNWLRTTDELRNFPLEHPECELWYQVRTYPLLYVCG